MLCTCRKEVNSRTGKCRLLQLGTYVEEDVARDDIPVSGENVSMQHRLKCVVQRDSKEMETCYNMTARITVN